MYCCLLSRSFFFPVPLEQQHAENPHPLAIVWKAHQDPATVQFWHSSEVEHGKCGCSITILIMATLG